MTDPFLLGKLGGMKGIWMAAWLMGGTALGAGLRTGGLQCE